MNNIDEVGQFEHVLIEIEEMEQEPHFKNQYCMNWERACGQEIIQSGLLQTCLFEAEKLQE